MTRPVSGTKRRTGATHPREDPPGVGGKDRVQELDGSYTFRTITSPSGMERYQILSVMTDSTG
jgi:hypothetical protein